ncbi:hypothetical protein [Bradyrhizobium sp. AUGA SZCCT0431]|uniref:hypothetical protein n=1 Tax=Bradyrhizobium sp. AUGA SZCCT0431 TaxID=2807674 RepID=UPI001BA9B739|nr:hypothetical protein [Bradyrhizobium sp. AUGA SZCCT0431]MBR1145196.1 hypothetical protein [Bradyrhizobium sp. AUGA SZCCT0431]
MTDVLAILVATTLAFIHRGHGSHLRFIFGSYLLGALLISGTAHAADQLPTSMLGKWASDAVACGQQSSELGMTVEPRTVLFYEHGYHIKRITRLRDGSLKGTGYGFADDGRSNDSITLKLIDPNKLQAKGDIYFRCEKHNGGAR